MTEPNALEPSPAAPASRAPKVPTPACTASEVPVVRRFSTFVTVWTGQSVSLVGSELTAFVLGLWAFRETGSATWFTLVVFFANLPLVLLLPFAGALVDRWNRRRTLVFANIVAALVILGLSALVFSGHMERWHIFPAVALVAAANAFHWPAYAGLPALIVPTHHLGRAAGMVELGRAGAQALAPMLGGVLIGALTLGGVLTLDVLTFLFAILLLLLVKLPRPDRSDGRRIGPRMLTADVAVGWRYITDRPGLIRLLLFFVVLNVFFSAAFVLLVPMIAAFTDNRSLGIIASVGAAGMVVGGLLMSSWGGPPRKILSLVTAVLVIGGSAVAASVGTSAPVVASAMFGFYIGFTVVNASAQAIWQVKVPPAMQGRVFALRRTAAIITVPPAFFVAGPIADRIFEPLFAPDGMLGDSVGHLIGTGSGRGIAFFVLLLGLFIIAIGGWALSSPRLMNLEAEVPDAVDEARA